MKKMLFFVNPVAGKEEMRHQLMDTISCFTANGYDVLCHPTQKPRDIPEFIAARGAEFDMIVTCGGDGTLNETVSGMMELPEHQRPLLGYIPAGTVNDFASSLHIPKNLPEAVRNIVEGEPFPVDLGCFNGQYFTYVAAFGAFTKVSYATPHASKQALGRAAYILEGIRSLKDIRPIHVAAEANGQRIEDDVILGMVTNATSVGGFKALDDSVVKMDDGLNEIILVKAPKGLADYNALLASLATRDFNPEYFHILQSDHVVMEFREPVAWTLDGEYGGESNHVEVLNVSTPVRVIVPAQK
ncbi:MAG: YegS/Rv2252/BmrU family lipid kinase [Oscillospiraceae bacterium]|nr:YegS/Rv2252/BmrU family lipid kinase [Oscillospiraceae bacterium]